MSFLVKGAQGWCLTILASPSSLGVYSESDRRCGGEAGRAAEKLSGLRSQQV